MVQPHYLRRARFWLAVFASGLVLSGITAFPLQSELSRLVSILRGSPLQTIVGSSSLLGWIEKVNEGVRVANERYPFLAYGTDWLAFAHLVIAIVFIGPYNPVRNKWVITFGLIACGVVVPLAFHALRTLESVVNLSLEPAGVPPQTRSLEDGLHMRRDHGGSPKVVDLALHLTSNYCNPLQWADCFLSADEAADQFDLCSVAIKAFLRDMKASSQ